MTDLRSAVVADAVVGAGAPLASVVGGLRGISRLWPPRIDGVSSHGGSQAGLDKKVLAANAYADAWGVLKNHSTATPRLSVSVGRFRITEDASRGRAARRQFARLCLGNRRLRQCQRLDLIYRKTAATTYNVRDC